MPSNVSAFIRSAACLATGGFLFNLTVLNEHLQLRPLGVVMLLAFEGLLIAAAALIFLKDAKPPPPNVMHLTTRNISIVQELVISGGAAMFALFGLYIFMGAGCDEVWAGHVERRGPNGGEYLIAAFFLVVAFPGFFFRPSFTFDLARRTIQRFPFGRALPWRKGPERPSTDIRVYSDGYWITNTGIKIGEMIRGKLGKNTIELEMLRGQISPKHLETRIEHWRNVLAGGARRVDTSQEVTAPGGA